MRTTRECTDAYPFRPRRTGPAEQREYQYAPGCGEEVSLCVAHCVDWGYHKIAKSLKYYCPEAYPVSLEDTADWSNNQSQSFLNFMPKPMWRLLFEIREEARYRKYLQTSHPATFSGPPTNDEHIEKENDVIEEVDGLGKLWRPVELVRSVDLVVATGGGIMCDHAKGPALRVLDTLETAIKLGKPTAMTGQQMGPMQDPELLARAHAVLPSVGLIAIRERKAAMALLQSLNVSMDRVVMTGDDAIEDAYYARSKKLGSGIGVSVRVQDYTNIADTHLRTVKDVLQQAATRHNAPLVSLPISESFHEADFSLSVNL